MSVADNRAGGLRARLPFLHNRWVRGGLNGYGLAVLSVVVCFLVRWQLDSILRNHLPFGLFVFSVLFTAWRAGLGPSLLATGLSMAGGFWFFVEPRYQFAAPDAVGWISLGSYLFTAVFICWYGERMRRGKRRLEEDTAMLNTQIKVIVEAQEQELERLVRERTAEVERLKSQFQEENYPREKSSPSHGGYRLVGQTPGIRHVLAQAEQVAPTDCTVLLLGETGTGKELLAATIHELSARRGGTLVSVNCAAMPAPLVESELFGREKGAFTGSLARQIGRFELADHSTIFLDEVGELSPEVQSKLLRVLETKQVERLGNPKPVPVDVRVIAASNRDLEAAMREGKFRQDLYYRLNVFPILVPPLRERREDIALLVWSFVDEFAKLFNKNIQSIEKECLDALQHYSWPGNVRELRNVIERAMIIATGQKLRIQLPTAPAPLQLAGSGKLEEVERQYILGVLEKTGWRIRGDNGAADQLGLKPTTLEARMAKLGIHRPTALVELP